MNVPIDGNSPPGKMYNPSGFHQTRGAIQVAGIVTIGAGVPFTALAGTDLNGDGDGGHFPSDRARRNPADPGSAVTRNSERLPAEATVDLRVSRRFPVRDRLILEPIFEVFNLFNRANFIETNNVAPAGIRPSRYARSANSCAPDHRDRRTLPCGCSSDARDAAVGAASRDRGIRSWRCLHAVVAFDTRRKVSTLHASVACDALIVGGGPAGSSCARALVQAGWNVIVLDRARFPRDKVCAGWVTPGVFRLLDLDPAEYRATGLTIQTITGFRTSLIGSRPVETRYPAAVSYAIRRCEFDDFLLRRSGARVLGGTPLTSLERRGDAWIANGDISAHVVVGAGGHFCPVARQLRGGTDDVRPVVAKEAEFPLEPGGSSADGELPELFFCEDLEGYGWCVRKGEYLNIGLGRRDHGDLNPHIDAFMHFLEARGLARRASKVRWHGHAYLASGAGPRPLVDEGVLVAGDAAGLAYPESGEGIRPAVDSGRLAAETLIAADGRIDREGLLPYATELRRRYPEIRATPRPIASIIKALGRRLLRSPAFTRRVLIDRWFLRESN